MPLPRSEKRNFTGKLYNYNTCPVMLRRLKKFRGVKRFKNLFTSVLSFSSPNQLLLHHELREVLKLIENKEATDSPHNEDEERLLKALKLVDLGFDGKGITFNIANCEVFAGGSASDSLDTARSHQKVDLP